MSNFSFSVHHIFQFRFWAYRRNCHAVLRQHATFYPYRITHLKDYQDCSRGSVIVRNGFRIWSRYFHQNAKFYYLQAKYCQYNSIHGRDVTICKNKRPPYWNSSSAFDFDHITIIRVLFCLMLPNFINIGPPNAKIWRHTDFSRWWPRRLNTTSGFLLVTSYCIRNVKIYLQTKFRRH